MRSAREHYETLLADVYEWSVSAAGDPFERGAAWLAGHELFGEDSYLDLGAGFGAHVLPLLRAGKHATAVDTSSVLLRRLARLSDAHAERLSLVEADLLGFLEGAGARAWSVILCLGDTLTHLEEHRAVSRLLFAAAAHLTSGGRLVLSYRDSSTFAAQGLARFVPVARDATRTMHCLLEAIDEERLRVTDIVTEVEADGLRTRISEYSKLRLAPEWVVAQAEPAGLALERKSVDQGMTVLVLRKI